MTLRKIPTALIFLTVALVAPGMPSFAAPPPNTTAASEHPDDAARAKALLSRAVEYMKKNGDRSLAAFSRVGEFTDGSLYIYVIDNNGVMQASNGGSHALIGRNMANYADADGKKFFQEMLDGARTQGSGSVEYRWLNTQHGKLEKKIAHYQAVGNRILAVGYYQPRATPEQAKAVLTQAIDALRRLGPDAFARFNDLNGGFIRDDTYVFVVGIKDFRMYAHGSMPRLVGKNVADLTDPDGQPIIREMLRIADQKGEGVLDYKWRNPVTKGIEKKRAYLQRVGDYLVAVGYYEP